VLVAVPWRRSVHHATRIRIPEARRAIEQYPLSRPFKETRLTPVAIDEATLDRMVQAMLDATRNQLLESISSQPFDTSDFAPFFHGLEVETERGLAIVSFSYIDEKLKQLMRLEMNKEVTGGLDSLFESFGPLSTASARIKIAAAMFWLSRETYSSLELLRKIRNAFAHRPFITGFDDKHVSGLLASLPRTEERLWRAVPEVFPANGELPLRTRFHVRTVLICSRMISELLSTPKAIRMGLPPGAGLERGFDGLPEPLREFTRASTRVALEVIARHARA
jgi:DNA-binding MltR family transcriptional regulator